MYGTTGPWVPGAALFVGARSACRSWHLRSSIREIYRRHCRLWCAYDTLPTRPRIRGENRREDPQRILSPKNLPQALALKLCSVSQTPRPVQMTPRRSPPSGVGDLNRKKAVFPYQRVQRPHDRVQKDLASWNVQVAIKRREHPAGDEGDAACAESRLIWEWGPRDAPERLIGMIQRHFLMLAGVPKSAL
eukprot:4135785-Prymnesium_polylepis.1